MKYVLIGLVLIASISPALAKGSSAHAHYHTSRITKADRTVYSTEAQVTHFHVRSVKKPKK